MARRCPHFSAGKDGRWLVYRCSSKDACYELSCQANPFHEEPAQDDPDE